MLKISFVRHGVTDWNMEGRIQGSIDTSLNEQGIWMSERLANRLQNEQWDAIYTSPAKRARQTAQVIARKHSNCPLILDHRLKEIGEGSLEGTTEKERIQMWGNDWHQTLLGREAEASIYNRAQSFFGHLERGKNTSILIISHGSFIYEMLIMLKVITPGMEQLKNGSLTTMEFGQKTLCTLYNCTRHLS